ncbi:16857_t:CDS:1, partial [Cetraspora pellucida]
KHISPRHEQIPTGHKPKWFTILEEKTIIHSLTRKLNSNLSLLQTNSLSFRTEHYNLKSKPWLIT